MQCSSLRLFSAQRSQSSRRCFETNTEIWCTYSYDMIEASPNGVFLLFSLFFDVKLGSKEAQISPKITNYETSVKKNEHKSTAFG